MYLLNIYFDMFTIHVVFVVLYFMKVLRKFVVNALIGLFTRFLSVLIMIKILENP